MLRRIPLFLIVVALLHPSPAGAFLDVLDTLQEKLDSAAVSSSSTPTSGIDELLENLQEAQGPTFTDVPDSAWYAEYVKSIATWHIADGYKNEKGDATGLFGPGDPVTVAQFLKMALKAAKVDEKLCTFAVQNPYAVNHWAWPYVSCAEERGFRLFLTDPPPELDRTALRAEVLTILDDAFEEEVPPFMSPFQDTQGHRYENDIAYANFRGIVAGDTDLDGQPTWIFRPDETLNRAEAAKIIYEQLKAKVMAEKNGDAIAVNVIVRNYSFTPKNIKIKKGQLVTFHFHVSGMHTFTVPGLEINKLLISPEESFSIVPDHTGTFPFQCVVKGHKEMGMEGVMTITE